KKPAAPVRAALQLPGGSAPAGRLLLMAPVRLSNGSVETAGRSAARSNGEAARFFGKDLLPYAPARDLVVLLAAQRAPAVSVAQDVAQVLGDRQRVVYAHVLGRHIAPGGRIAAFHDGPKPVSQRLGCAPASQDQIAASHRIANDPE